MIDFHAYIPFVNRPDLLEGAIQSIASIRDELTVVDNSTGGICGIGFEVFRPPVPMSFSQSQNYFFWDAKRRGCDFIVWLHNDVAVPEGVFPQLLEEARSRKGKKWGVLYTYYDIVSAVNVEAAHAVGGYDTNIRAYKSDQDFYHRLRLAGYSTEDTNLKVDELREAHLGSQTIRSDSRLAMMNGVVQQVDAMYYEAKWGGEAGKEVFQIPFNRKY